MGAGGTDKSDGHKLMQEEVAAELTVYAMDFWLYFMFFVLVLSLVETPNRKKIASCFPFSCITVTPIHQIPTVLFVRPT
jgi:hypothetical protein